MKLILTLLVLASCDSVFSARILTVFPISAKSHHILFKAILRTLAERGHEVVAYSTFPADKYANYTVVSLKRTNAIEKLMTREFLDHMLSLSPIGAAKLLWMQAGELIGNLGKQEKFIELILSNQKFDLIIIEAFFSQEALLALGHKFKAPVICLQPFGTFSVISSTAGSPLNLAYIPDFAFPYSDKMSFYERALSSYSIISSLYIYYNKHIPEMDRLMKVIFKDPYLPPLVDLMKNVSLFINNLHPYVHYSQPYTPNQVPIGGLHLDKDTNPLPQYMRKFLDEAPNGAIYFSMGSVLPDHLFDEEYFEDFIYVFSRLPQRVLWKTTKEIKILPSNIMTVKWAPQQDILAHPNIKLFITHGGLHSQHEAIHAGVPVVCIPFFGDQPSNAKFYEARGVGVTLLFKSISKHSIYSALNTVLRNVSYKENMARLSKIYRDRPHSPAESLNFWVEYVLRHGGAPHLRPAAAAMPWYQLTLMDIFASLLGVLALFSVLSYIIIIKCIIKLFYKRINKYSIVGRR